MEIRYRKIHIHLQERQTLARLSPTLWLHGSHVHSITFGYFLAAFRKFGFGSRPRDLTSTHYFSASSPYTKHFLEAPFGSKLFQDRVDDYRRRRR